MSYTEDQKATALAALQANGGNLIQTSKVTGIPRTTLRLWRDDKNVPATVAEKCQQKKEDLADKLERLAQRLADASFGKAEEANLQSCATSMAIAIDKMQLLREKPTNINAQYDSREARIGRITELLTGKSANQDGSGIRRTPVPFGVGEQPEQPTVQ